MRQQLGVFLPDLQILPGLAAQSLNVALGFQFRDARAQSIKLDV